jgi:hypothetical protein
MWHDDPGPVHPPGPGQELALQMPQVFPLQRPAQGQVLRQRQQCLLQNRLFQVRQNKSNLA